MMRLISMVTAADDAFGCDYALVELTPDLGRLALRRIAMLRDQKRTDADLCETYFWDYHAEYFSPWIAEAKECDESLAEMLDGLPTVAEDWMEAPAEFSIPDSLRARMECCQIIVRESGIAFVAIPKHTSSYVTTAEIPLMLLEAATAA